MLCAIKKNGKGGEFSSSIYITFKYYIFIKFARVINQSKMSVFFLTKIFLILNLLG